MTRLADDDHIPLLTTKAPDPQLAGTGSDADDRTHNKEQITMNPTAPTSDTPTGTPSPVDAGKAATLMLLASERGITVAMQATLRGTTYRVWSPDDELLAWTYDLAEADNAVHNYWPATTTVGTVQVGRESVRVDLSPAFAGDPERVYIEGSMGDGLTIAEAARLSLLLAEAVTA